LSHGGLFVVRKRRGGDKRETGENEWPFFPEPHTTEKKKIKMNESRKMSLFTSVLSQNEKCKRKKLWLNCLGVFVVGHGKKMQKRKKRATKVWGEKKKRKKEGRTSALSLTNGN